MLIFTCNYNHTQIDVKNHTLKTAFSKETENRLIYIYITVSLRATKNCIVLPFNIF